MKKIFQVLLVGLTILTLAVPLLAKADGAIIPPQDYYMYQTDQEAVIVYEEGVETLILSITFRGDAKDFGWVVPVPSRPEVDKSSDELFTSLSDLTKPKEEVYGIRPLLEKGLAPAGEEVTVIETKEVGPYKIQVLEATDPDALAKWLSENKYQYPKEGGYILEEYVKNGWYFVACKIRPEIVSGGVTEQLKQGHATPIKLTFKSDKIIYPLKISSLQSTSPITKEETEIKKLSPEPDISYIMPPSSIGILLYVFAQGKKELPGFDIQYANWIKPKQIEKLAYVEGEPWMKAEHKYYLTRLYSSMSPASFTSDLIFREAEDNKPVNAGKTFWQNLLTGFLYFLLIFVIWILSPLGVIFIAGVLVKFLAKSKIAHILALVFQSLMLLCCLVITLWFWLTKGINLLGGVTIWQTQNVPTLTGMITSLIIVLVMILTIIWEIVRQKKKAR